MTESGRGTTPESLRRWYKGPSLTQQLDSFEPIARPPPDSPLRFTLADVYKTASQGLTVSGKVEGGFVVPQQRLQVYPGGQSTSVRSISRGGRAVDAAVSGDSVELGLAGIDETVLSSGQILCWPNHPVPVVQKIQAQILTFDTLRIPIVRGQQFMLHTQHLEASSLLRLQEMLLAHCAFVGLIKVALPNHSHTHLHYISISI